MNFWKTPLPHVLPFITRYCVGNCLSLEVSCFGSLSPKCLHLLSFLPLMKYLNDRTLHLCFLLVSSDFAVKINALVHSNVFGNINWSIQFTWLSKELAIPARHWEYFIISPWVWNVTFFIHWILSWFHLQIFYFVLLMQMFLLNLVSYCFDIV